MEKLSVSAVIAMPVLSDAHYRAAEEKLETAQAESAEKEFMAALGRAVKQGIPAKDVELVIGQKGLRKTRALDAVQAPPDGARFIVLSGGVGCGKTTAASWWLWHGDHRHAPYVRSNPPLFVTGAWIERHSRYDHESFDGLETAKALVVDDLGMEFADAKGNFLADLDALLDARYRNLLATVLTTNLESDDFKRRYGRRLRSRIHERGCFLNVNGTDLRRR